MYIFDKQVADHYTEDSLAEYFSAVPRWVCGYLLKTYIKADKDYTKALYERKPVGFDLNQKKGAVYETHLPLRASCRQYFLEYGSDKVFSRVYYKYEQQGYDPKYFFLRKLFENRPHPEKDLEEYLVEMKFKSPEPSFFSDPNKVFLLITVAGAIVYSGAIIIYLKWPDIRTFVTKTYDWIFGKKG